MHHRFLRAMGQVVAVLLLTWLGAFLKPTSPTIAHMQVRVPLVSSPLTASSLPSPTPTTASRSVAGTTSGLDPTIIGALIGLVGTITAALITGGYFKRRRKGRGPQPKEKTKRVLKTIEEYTQAYRNALCGDPLIANLQVPNMSRPLEVMNLYVRPRVEEGGQLGYELDPDLRAAAHDLNALLRASSLALERRISTALDPVEAIRTWKHCIFVGGPGAGKTTLLKYLTLKSAGGELADLPDLPIFIDLNAFTSSGDSDLLDFAAAMWEQRYRFPKTEARQCMEERLTEGKAMLLLDGLEETIDSAKQGNDEPFARMEAVITILMQRYHRSPIVLTARKAEYQQQAPLAKLGIEQLEVLDFRPEDIKVFVKRWFANSSHPNRQAIATDLVAKLEHNPRIYSLAATPLLLSLIAIVYEAQLDLPDRRAKLYEQCVDILLDKWNAKRNIRRRSEFKIQHKQQLLKEIAWHFHTQGKTYFPENELLEVIANSLSTLGLPTEQNRKVLEEITVENGLLKKQTRDLYGFSHLTLQEYFVAQYLVDQNSLDVLLAHQGDPWWEEVMQLYAGSTPDASLLLEKLLGRGGKTNVQEDIFQTGLLLAAHCLASRPTIQQVSRRDEVISRLFDALKATKFSLTRQQIADALSEIGGAEINAHLSNLLPDENIHPEVRIRIAEALGTYGKRSLTPELLPLLTDEQIYWDVRSAIARAIGLLGEQSVAPELVNLIPDQRVHLEVRRSVALAIGALGEQFVASRLVSLLSDQQIDPLILRSVALAVGALGEQSVASQLISLLSNRQIDPFVRMGIALTLGTLGEKSVVPKLVLLLSEQQIDPDVRQSIALALGTLGERSIVPKLLRLLSNRQVDTDVRVGIASALGVLGDRSLALKLLELLSEQQVEQEVRANIALALGALGERSIIPDLLRLLSNQQIDHLLRQNIALALGMLGERSVVPNLLALLSVGQQLTPEIRQSVTLALGILGKRNVAPNLLPLLSNEQIDPFVRQSIANTLGALGERSVVPEMCSLLANEHIDYSVRQSTVYALEQLATDELSVNTLANLLLKSDIADDIHRVLWTVSRRAGVRICIMNTRVEVIKW